jgi:hypothetical protein
MKDFFKKIFQYMTSCLKELIKKIRIFFTKYFSNDDYHKYKNRVASFKKGLIQSTDSMEEGRKSIEGFRDCLKKNDLKEVSKYITSLIENRTC